MKINAKLRKNASKYIEWIPESLLPELKHMVSRWDTLSTTHPLALLIAGFARSIDAAYLTRYIEWKQRIVDDLGVTGYDVRNGSGWNFYAWPMLVESVNEDDLGERYQLSSSAATAPRWHRRYEAFIFSVSPMRDFINWNEWNPLDVEK